jgi:hypothetical protein
MEVTDSGIGMDEATRQRIFDPFFTTKDAGRGTGLGLATVQGIIAQSGGYISVRSEPGAGAVFTVELPLVAQPAGHRGAETHLPAAPGKGTILVVEDQDEVRAFTVAALEQFGYRVIPAAGADEAMLLYLRAEAPVDLLLTDVVMPQTSGPELAAHLAGIHPGIKVLYMSGYPGDRIGRGTENRSRLQEGEFIQKPFTPDVLVKKIQTILASVTAPGEL